MHVFISPKAIIRGALLPLAIAGFTTFGAMAGANAAPVLSQAQASPAADPADSGAVQTVQYYRHDHRWRRHEHWRRERYWRHRRWHERHYGY